MSKASDQLEKTNEELVGNALTSIGINFAQKDSLFVLQTDIDPRADKSKPPLKRVLICLTSGIVLITESDIVIEKEDAERVAHVLNLINDSTPYGNFEINKALEIIFKISTFQSNKSVDDLRSLLLQCFSSTLFTMGVSVPKIRMFVDGKLSADDAAKVS